MTCVTVKEQLPAAIHGGGGFFSPGVSKHVEVCLQPGLPLDHPLIHTAESELSTDELLIERRRPSIGCWMEGLFGRRLCSPFDQTRHFIWLGKVDRVAGGNLDRFVTGPLGQSTRVLHPDIFGSDRAATAAAWNCVTSVAFAK